jgi:hypothetical protein
LFSRFFPKIPLVPFSGEQFLELLFEFEFVKETWLVIYFVLLFELAGRDTFKSWMSSGVFQDTFFKYG